MRCIKCDRYIDTSDYSYGYKRSPDSFICVGWSVKSKEFLYLCEDCSLEFITNIFAWLFFKKGGMTE